MTTMTLTVDGKEYIAIPKKEFQRYQKLMKAPRVPLPSKNKQGDVDAAAYLSASIANSLIEDREAVGLSQKELAEKAGIRVETLNRAERGAVVPDTRTLQKIDKALKAAGLKR